MLSECPVRCQQPVRIRFRWRLAKNMIGVFRLSITPNWACVPRLLRNNHFADPKSKFAVTCGSSHRGSTRQWTSSQSPLQNGLQGQLTHQVWALLVSFPVYQETDWAITYPVPKQVSPGQSGGALPCMAQWGRGKLGRASKSQCGAWEPKQELAKQLQRFPWRVSVGSFPKRPMFHPFAFPDFM